MEKALGDEIKLLQTPEYRIQCELYPNFLNNGQVLLKLKTNT